MTFSKQFTGGLLTGLGLGLMLGAALVELELLTTQQKAWAAFLGAVLFGIGGILSRSTKPAGEPRPPV